MAYPCIPWIVWGNNGGPVDATLAAAPDATAQDRASHGLPEAEEGDWAKIVMICQDDLEKIIFGHPGQVADNNAIPAVPVIAPTVADPNVIDYKEC